MSGSVSGQRRARISVSLRTPLRERHWTWHMLLPAKLLVPYMSAGGPWTALTLQHDDFEVKKKGYITDCFANERRWPSVRDGRQWAQVNVLSVENFGPKWIMLLFPFGISVIHDPIQTFNKLLSKPAAHENEVKWWLVITCHYEDSDKRLRHNTHQCTHICILVVRQLYTLMLKSQLYI